PRSGKAEEKRPLDRLPGCAGQVPRCWDRARHRGTYSWLVLLGKPRSRLSIKRLLFHVVDIVSGGIVVIHKRPVPIGLRKLQCFPLQLIGDFPSLLMLADGVGAGTEQAVDGVLLVLLLLVHHGTVLSAGQAAVLGCHTAAVFGLVS